jgi:hypothetical protein
MVLQRLSDLLRDYEPGILVVSELHADGHPHLHCYIRFSDVAPRIRDARYFDIDGYHPNVQSARSWKKWLLYCLKSDKSPVYTNLDIDALRKKPSERVTDVIARRIESGATGRVLYNEFPGFYMSNMRKLLDFERWISNQVLREQKRDWNLVSSVQGANDTSQEVALWIQANIRKERPLRTPQLWLYGPPGCGKTSLALQLEEYLSVYWVPMDMDFLEGFDDNYDLIVFDEMKSQRKLTWLNQFIVGSPMIVNQKGTSVIKKRNVPVMFLSNVGPATAFSKDTPQRDAFLSRLHVVCCNEVRIELQTLNLNH